jgi:hypothetical protein
MREKKKATNKPGTNTHAKLKIFVQASTRFRNATPSSTTSMHHADTILGNVGVAGGVCALHEKLPHPHAQQDTIPIGPTKANRAVPR